jgi:hypothetical protein
MDEPSTTSDNRDQTDEAILTYTASDEALEAATGFGAGPQAAAQTLGALSAFCLVCPVHPGLSLTRSGHQ